MALADCRAAVWVRFLVEAFRRKCSSSLPVTVCIVFKRVGHEVSSDAATIISLRSFGHSASCCFKGLTAAVWTRQ